MKIFTRTLFIVMALMGLHVGANAQVDNTFRFVDQKTENEIPDGGTYTAVVEKVDIIPGILSKMEAKFYIDVENTTGDVAYVSAHVVSEELAGGKLQFCFPNQCPPTVPADYISDTGTMAAGEKKGLQAEWTPVEGQYGTARFTVQLRTMEVTKWIEKGDIKLPSEYALKANGPKLTINCIYADPAGVDDVKATGLTTYNVYDMTGRRVVENGTEADVQSLGKGLFVRETVIGGKRVSAEKIVR